MPSVGILAYGSLIYEPGEEIGPLVVKRLSIETPFCVEFARSSSTRGIVNLSVRRISPEHTTVDDC